MSIRKGTKLTYFILNINSFTVPKGSELIGTAPFRVGVFRDNQFD